MDRLLAPRLLPLALALAVPSCAGSGASQPPGRDAAGGGGPGVDRGANPGAEVAETPDDVFRGSEGAPSDQPPSSGDERARERPAHDTEGGAGDGPPPAPEPDPPIACRRTVPVTTSAALSAAVGAAAPGDCIVLADGSYAVGKITRSGTAESPILITAANRLRATITSGQLELLGAAHVIIQGLSWSSASTIKLTDSHHCRLTRCRFRLAEQESLKWVIIQGAGSHHNRIDHSDFGPKSQTGNFITVDGSETASSQHDRIDHNHFHDSSPRAANEKEAIRVGWSAISRSSGFTIVEHNLFSGCDGDPEIVSVKTCDNVIRFNTVRGSQGTLSLRHGTETRSTATSYSGSTGRGRAGSGSTARITGSSTTISRA